MANQDALFGRTVLVSGPEALLADRAVAELKQQALLEVPEAQVNDVEAPLLDGGQLAEMTGGSLFSAASIAIIRDLANLPADLTDAVAGLAQDTPPDVCLVLAHGGGVKGKGLLDKVKKTRCQVIEAAAVKPWDLPQFVTAEGRRLGVRLDRGAVDALVEGVGHDLRALASALSQLQSDADGAPITESLVRRYFGGRAEVTSFKVADDVMAGNRAGALEKLRWALETGVAPVLVTSALAGNLRNLGKYLELRGRRLRDNELAAHIGCPPFKIKDLNRFAKSWDAERVAAGIALVAYADANIKGAAGSPDFALERLVLALSTPPPRPGR